MILNRVNKTNTAKIVNRVTANINNTTAERVNNSITEQWVNHPINKTSKKGKACPPDNRLDFLVEANLKREPISNANNLKKGSRHIGYTLWRKGLNGLRFDSQYLEWVCQEGEKGGLLMHASIPTIHFLSLVFSYIPLFSILSSSFFSTSSIPPFHCSWLPPFYNICHCGIYPFCP